MMTETDNIKCTICLESISECILYPHEGNLYCPSCWDKRGNFLWEEINDKEEKWLESIASRGCITSIKTDFNWQILFSILGAIGLVIVLVILFNK